MSVKNVIACSCWCGRRIVSRWRAECLAAVAARADSMAPTFIEQRWLIRFQLRLLSNGPRSESHKCDETYRIPVLFLQWYDTRRRSRG